MKWKEISIQWNYFFIPCPLLRGAETLFFSSSCHIVSDMESPRYLLSRGQIA